MPTQPTAPTTALIELLGDRAGVSYEGSQAEAGATCDPPGSVMLHPAAVAGTNSDVLADAKMRDAEGSCTPRVTGSAVVQTNFVVSAEPSALMPMTRNVAETGMVMQSSDPLIVPRSSDQDPPGVFGWLRGKARTSWRLQGPGMQLPFATSKVMPPRGSTDEEQAANNRSDAAATKRASDGAGIVQWKLAIHLSQNGRRCRR